MNENTNTQTPPVSEPPAAAGPTAAELQAQLDEVKKQSEGRLRDLQNERAKRQELETRLSNPPVSAPSAANPDVTQDELGKVLNPYIAPIQQQVKVTQQFMQQYETDKAMNYLKDKTGKSVEAIKADVEFQQKLVATAQRWGFTGSLSQITERAYEAMQLEEMRNKETERARAAAAAGASSIPSGTPPPPVASAKSYSQSDWEAMPLHEYDKLSANGTFHQNDKGEIVYTPNK